MLKKLNELKICIGQLEVIPGRPDLNTKNMTNEITLAIKRNVDIIIFPEMCVSGYLIGDLYENNAFIQDVIFCNEQIREATKGGIVVIFGSITVEPKNKGEDGRWRKFNTALVAQDGRWVGSAIKTLQPNYRFFYDDRHFYSVRKIYEEEFARRENEDVFVINDYLYPIAVKIGGFMINLGVSLCEDMWHQNYMHNPIKNLVENGAEIIFNLSASPWTWQKNRKRHEIAKELIGEIGVPLIYVNNVGAQNTGKNIIVFDGNSTAYNRRGEVIFEIAPYLAEARDFIFNENNSVVSETPINDTQQLYRAIRTAAESFLNFFPLHKRKIVIGLSGGIDSATTAALYVDILGPENVIGVNMPFKYNSEETKLMARQIAQNLGIKFEIKPIGPLVEAICSTVDVEQNSIAYENIQARARIEIIAAMAQKIGGVFSANWNKVEAAFGYGTLYGDTAGFLAVLGDLVKREVYQLADYLNRVVYKKEVIPLRCFQIAPSAELAVEQKDPFDYGNLNRRGYHDEMVRAFVEFRRDPEWFINAYAKGTLEKELLLEAGLLNKLFLTPHDFIKDLEKNWERFCGSYFKRVQSAPIPIVSKRAFGNDLWESIMPAYLTQRYYDIKKFLLSQSSDKTIKQIAIFGGSFNPPSKHHRKILERLVNYFDLVVVVPCGKRSDKPSANIISVEHRSKMTKIAFGHLPSAQIDLYDLENNVFTPTYFLQQRYEKMFKDAQIWHAVGSDIIVGGKFKDSEIHRVWHRGAEMWQNFNFVVMARLGYGVGKDDLPPSSKLIEINDVVGSGTMIRQLIRENQPIADLVDPLIAKYIYENGLYKNNGVIKPA